MVEDNGGVKKIRFVFDEEKAAQAAAFMIRLFGNGPISNENLLRLLYLADRQTLLETCQPITGDHMDATSRGLSLSNIHKLIHPGTGKVPGHGIVWSCWLKSEDYKTKVRGTPPEDRLSRYDTGVLESVHADFGEMEPLAFHNYMLKLPEWEKPKEFRQTIPYERILEAAGKTPDQIERCRREAASAWHFHHVLSGNWREAGLVR